MKALREHSKVRSSAKIAKYMKGGNVTDCRADDGTVKAKRPTQSVPITVDGKAARPRLDRPMRKRADGGSTISEDSRREADRLESAADKKERIGAGRGIGAGILGGAALFSRRAGPAIRALAGVGSIGEGATSAGEIGDSLKMRREAADIRAGRAASGKEDYKQGGRVKK